MTTFTCPAPIAARNTVLLGHGSGGKLSAELLRDVFLPTLANDVLSSSGGPGELGNRWRAPGFHYRFVRGEAAVLSGRRHRFACP